jgi:predicted nucleic-acid-binding protein
LIGLDSNVLVRYLTQDDAVQSKKADQLIEKALSAGDPLYLNQIVICEVSWVLGSAYGYGMSELADTIEKILTAAQFAFEDKNSLWQALAAFRTSGSDFADCLIGARNFGAGCVTTLTFDKRAGRLPQFSLS